MTNDSVYRRENIIWNAIELIHECGIHSVSTKMIAKRLGISEGTIFNNFSKKNDILMAVLQQFAMYDEDMFKTAQNKKENPKEAILFYIDSYLIYYQNYPDITALIQTDDVLRGIPELEEKSNRIFFTRFQYMRKLIEEAQMAGVLCEEADAEALADIFTSTCKGICIRWRISGFTFSLREKTIQAVTMLLNAFSPQK